MRLGALILAVALTAAAVGAALLASARVDATHTGKNSPNRSSNDLGFRVAAVLMPLAGTAAGSGTGRDDRGSTSAR